MRALTRLACVLLTALGLSQANAEKTAATPTAPLDCSSAEHGEAPGRFMARAY